MGCGGSRVTADAGATWRQAAGKAEYRVASTPDGRTNDHDPATRGAPPGHRRTSGASSSSIATPLAVRRESTLLTVDIAGLLGDGVDAGADEENHHDQVVPAATKIRMEVPPASAAPAVSGAGHDAEHRDGAARLRADGDDEHEGHDRSGGAAERAGGASAGEGVGVNGARENAVAAAAAAAVVVAVACRAARGDVRTTEDVSGSGEAAAGTAPQVIHAGTHSHSSSVPGLTTSGNASSFHDMCTNGGDGGDDEAGAALEVDMDALKLDGLDSFRRERSCSISEAHSGDSSSSSSSLLVRSNFGHAPRGRGLQAIAGGSGCAAPPRRTTLGPATEALPSPPFTPPRRRGRCRVSLPDGLHSPGSRVQGGSASPALVGAPASSRSSCSGSGIVVGRTNPILARRYSTFGDPPPASSSPAVRALRKQTSAASSHARACPGADAAPPRCSPGVAINGDGSPGRRSGHHVATVQALKRGAFVGDNPVVEHPPPSPVAGVAGVPSGHTYHTAKTRGASASIVSVDTPLGWIEEREREAPRLRGSSLRGSSSCGSTLRAGAARGSNTFAHGVSSDVPSPPPLLQLELPREDSDVLTDVPASPVVRMLSADVLEPLRCRSSFVGGESPALERLGGSRRESIPALSGADALQQDLEAQSSGHALTCGSPRVAKRAQASPHTERSRRDSFDTASSCESETSSRCSGGGRPSGARLRVAYRRVRSSPHVHALTRSPQSPYVCLTSPKSTVSFCSEASQGVSVYRLRSRYSEASSPPHGPPSPSAAHAGALARACPSPLALDASVEA